MLRRRREKEEEEVQKKGVITDVTAMSMVGECEATNCP